MVRRRSVTGIGLHEPTTKIQLTVHKTKRFAFWAISWISCSVLMGFFARDVYQEYMELNPISIVSLQDPPKKAELITLKICNEGYLDKLKIVNYNGSEVTYESYGFLHQAILTNSALKGSFRRYRHPLREYFLMPFKIYDVFKYDLENFMMACLYEGSNKSCLFDFKFQPESQAPCYAANLDVSGYGIFQYLEIFLYFDPKMTIGKHTPKLGSYVTFSHVENFVSPINGFFLAPNEAAVVSATGVYTHQRESFPKAKCTLRNGLEKHDFTGEPFYALYSPESCVDLCYAKYQTKVCNCSTLVGWNITESRCMDEEEKRKCLLEKTSNATLLRIRTEKCLSRCHPKCRQKKFDIKFSKTQNSLVETDISTIIELIERSENISSAAREVASKLRRKDESFGKEESCSEHCAAVFLLSRKAAVEGN